MRALFSAALVAFAAIGAEAASSFGYKSSSSSWVITTGGGLTVTMTQSTCDISSLDLNGNELQYSSKRTHINSGLGTVTSSIDTLSDLDDTIQITCEATGITQYYLFRSGENAIYMGTYHTTAADLSELRFLARLDRDVVAAGAVEATYDSTSDTAIEAEDVYSLSNGTTRSKFYSGVPFIDNQVFGVYSKSVDAGVYFVVSDLGFETSIGGPFWRDINIKVDTATELSFYMNSDHTRTESYRYGFHGPYALVFTSGDAPTTSSVDFDFFQSLDLSGLVIESGRGQISGSISDSADVIGSSDVVVAWSNDAAQYWSSLGASATSFKSPLMKPGTYNMTVYKKELAVSRTEVTITKGKTTSATAKVSYTIESDPIWRIGEWDGTPDGFLNADKIHRAHPSDVSMSDWEAITFKPGTDDDSDFPMAQFRSVNDPITLSFSLTSTQASSDRTLKIGVSLAQSSGRNSITVNSKYTPSVPASVAVKTRGVTRGVTMGNYKTYTYTIPSKYLVTGTNTITLTIASGSTDPDEEFLHASVVFDALELV